MRQGSAEISGKTSNLKSFDINVKLTILKFRPCDSVILNNGRSCFETLKPGQWKTEGNLFVLV